MRASTANITSPVRSSLSLSMSVASLSYSDGHLDKQRLFILFSYGACSDKQSSSASHRAGRDGKIIINNIASLQFRFLRFSDFIMKITTIAWLHSMLEKLLRRMRGQARIVIRLSRRDKILLALKPSHTVSLL